MPLHSDNEPDNRTALPHVGSDLRDRTGLLCGEIEVTAEMAAAGARLAAAWDYDEPLNLSEPSYEALARTIFIEMTRVSLCRTPPGR